MTDREEIKVLFNRLGEELTRAEMDREEPDLGKVYAPVSMLLGGMLTDLNRIANAAERQAAALEKLSTFSVERIGEILIGGTKD